MPSKLISNFPSLICVWIPSHAGSVGLGELPIVTTEGGFDFVEVGSAEPGVGVTNCVLDVLGETVVDLVGA